MEIEKVVKMIELLKEFENPAAETEAKENPAANDPLINQLVLVRTCASGVHFGTLLKNEGRLVELKNSRRLWYWEGAFTLNQVVMDGISGNSKVSPPVGFIRILDAIEIMPLSEEVYANLVSFEKDMSK